MAKDETNSEVDEAQELKEFVDKVHSEKEARIVHSRIGLDKGDYVMFEINKKSISWAYTFVEVENISSVEVEGYKWVDYDKNYKFFQVDKRGDGSVLRCSFSFDYCKVFRIKKEEYLKFALRKILADSI